MKMTAGAGGGKGRLQKAEMARKGGKSGGKKGRKSTRKG